MKIVLIDKEEGQKVGGIGIYTNRLYQHLKNLGHEAFILRFTQKKKRDKNILPLPYYLAEERGFVVLPSEKTLPIIRNHLERIKPDILYSAAGLSPFDFFIPSLSHDLKIPIAATWHADFNQSLSSFQILAKSLFLAYLPFCRQLDLLHVFSEKLAQFYINHGIAKKRVLILPNGVDEEFYTPGASFFAPRFGIKTGILFLGRLTFQKNPELLIKSFLSLDPPKETKLIMVGHGDEEEDLRENYKDKRVIFTGAVIDEKRKLDIIRSCQIFVLPSRFEGMPLSLLEAMSTGLACVASDAGGNRDLLSGAGITLPTAKIKQELPTVLRVLLEHPDFAKSLGQKARQKVQESFSQEIIFNHLIEAFQQTIINFQKSGPPKTSPPNLDKIISKKLRSIWRKAKQLTSYLET